jgi:hypothetical protein
MIDVSHFPDSSDLFFVVSLVIPASRYWGSCRSTLNVQRGIRSSFVTPAEPQKMHTRPVMAYPHRMAEDKQEPEEPAQETPRGHKIPVPTREQVLRDLRKVAKPPSERGRRRPQK